MASSRDLHAALQSMLMANNCAYNSDGVPHIEGFCDHSSFGGVGAAVPERVNLYRAQVIRGVGGNSWRMAHNPPIPSRLDMADALGILALDENHYYGGHYNRNSYAPHPSVL